MPRISGQVLVCVAAGLVLALVGLNSIRGGDDESGSSFEAAAAGSAAPQGADKSATGFTSSGGSRRLIVDVAGAVKRPGVYRFPHGARVIDAIEKAGGAIPGAMVGAINRAATLSDGQQVVVPTASGPAGASPAGPGAVPGVAGVAADAPISLGSATQEQLEEIDGIGPVTAGKILEFRDSQGGLSSIDELDQVSGIGPVTMESLRAALQP